MTNSILAAAADGSNAPSAALALALGAAHRDAEFDGLSGASAQLAAAARADSYLDLQGDQLAEGRSQAQRRVDAAYLDELQREAAGRRADEIERDRRTFAQIDAVPAPSIERPRAGHAMPARTRGRSRASRPAVRRARGSRRSAPPCDDGDGSGDDGPAAAARQRGQRLSTLTVARVTA